MQACITNNMVNWCDYFVNLTMYACVFKFLFMALISVIVSCNHWGSTCVIACCNETKNLNVL